MKLTNSNLTAELATARAIKLFETAGAEGKGFMLEVRDRTFGSGTIHHNPGREDACCFQGVSSAEKISKSSPNLAMALLHGEGNGRSCKKPYFLGLQLFLGSLSEEISSFRACTQLITLQYVFQIINGKSEIDRFLFLYDDFNIKSLSEIPHGLLPPVASLLIEAMQYLEDGNEDWLTGLNFAL